MGRDCRAKWQCSAARVFYTELLAMVKLEATRKDAVCTAHGGGVLGLACGRSGWATFLLRGGTSPTDPSPRPQNPARSLPMNCFWPPSRASVRMVHSLETFLCEGLSIAKPRTLSPARSAVSNAAGINSPSP